MKCTILGSGTSQGVPVVGCTCAVCSSTDPKDNRLRCAAYIEVNDDLQLLIDIGADIRQQMLRYKITDVDAILLTHEHNDHTAGMDDIRPINFLHDKDVPIYGQPRVMNDMRKRFHYIFSDVKYPGLPRITLNDIDSDSLHIKDVEIDIVPIIHGTLDIIGFRIGSFAYLTDASYLSDEAISRLTGVQYLVLNALRKRKHYSHFNLEEAIEAAEKIGAAHTYFTHISHHMGLHSDVNPELPAGMELAYDGLEIEFS